jgi:hypothetical protein
VGSRSASSNAPATSTACAATSTTSATFGSGSSRRRPPTERSRASHHRRSYGTLGQRKAVMETHIAEIRLDNDRLIPVYRIAPDAFRARGHVVGRAGLEPATEGL